MSDSLRDDLFVIVTPDGETLHATVSQREQIAWALAHAQDSREIDLAQQRGWKCVPCALVSR